MRITSFHVDGFGALSSFGEEDLAPGVVVVHGPNEAGKSTLFDFLTGVLFGFPPRRDNAHFHAPVRGGRHGGRVSFADDSGAEWTVERHAGPHRELHVQLPDGSRGDERDLARVLAGASPTLFRAVFAIGTDDLRQLDSLTTDEVRELLFASSIFGQRRSATKAIKELSDARDDLARPRREDARANRLARAIMDCRGELATARREMSGFEDLTRRARDAESRVAALHERSRSQRARERELELLLACWKAHSRAASARSALSELAVPPPDSDEGHSARTLLRLEPELHELMAQLSGHRERLFKLDELQHQRQGLVSSLQRRINLLGPGWTEDRVMQVESPELLADQARAARRELSDVTSDELTATALLDEATLDLCEITSGGDVVTDAYSGGCELPRGFGGVGGAEDLNGLRRYRDEIIAGRQAVQALRERIAELDEATGALLNSEQTPGSTYGNGRDLPAWVMVLAGLVLGGLAAVLAGEHQTAIAVLMGVVALLLIARALAGRRSQPRQAQLPGAPNSAFASRRASANEAAALAGRAREEIGRLAAELGLGLPPSKVDVERLDYALRSEAESIARREAHRVAQARAEAKVVTARGAVEAASSRREEAERAFAQWRRQCGFVADTPESVLEAIASIAEIKEDMKGLRRVETAIGGLERSVADFAGRLRPLQFVGPGDGDDDEPPWSEERLEDRLSFLIEMAADARALEQARLSLVQEINRADDEVDEAIGAGEGASRLRRELAGGQVLSWRRELDELETALEQVRQADESAVREHQSLTETMSQLATSYSIVALEQRLTALEDELDHVLDRYLVLGTARALLRRTLSLHERERQPAVIARAASHFERVTAGRYVSLVPSAGTDGRQNIAVVATNGATIDATDLSRGTIEQLYLCLRLGLADSFAERAVSLPIFLDDVLVNFDPGRAQAVATELAASASRHQIIFFTCHPHLAELALKASSEGPVPSQLVELGRL